MRAIMDLVNKIDEELKDAKDYAERYVEYKAKGKNNNVFHSMSEQELNHANQIHDIALTEIDELEKVFKPTEEMKKIWSDSHSNYVEKTAWIKMMLAM